MPVIISEKEDLSRDWKFLSLNFYDYVVLLIIYLYILEFHKKFFVNKRGYVNAFVRSRVFDKLRDYKGWSMTYYDFKKSINKLVKFGLLGVVGHKYLVQTQKGFDFVTKLIELNNIIEEK